MGKKNKKNKVQVKNEEKSQSKCPVNQSIKSPMKIEIDSSSDDESLHLEPIVPVNELKSSPLPLIPVIPRVESKNNRVESMEINYFQNLRDQKSSGKIPSHWLDVSMLDIQTPLIFEAFDQDGNLENGKKTKRIFKTLYNKFGSHESEIILIGIESDHIRLYFENGKSRYKIKKDLDFIIAHENEDLNLSVRIPILMKPSIQFISRSNIKEKKKSECLSKIKDYNNWPDETVLIFVDSIPLEGTDKFRMKITVDSHVRTLIEKQNGIIIDHCGNKVEVTDDLNLLRCQKCYDFGHLKSDCILSLWAKDKKYSIELSFYSFTPDACPTLAGKPKIFFIQACPEEKYHYSDDTCDENKDLSDSSRDEVDSASPDYTIPTWVDFFVAYSTVSDYCACRNVFLGSWFMQELAKVMKNLWIYSSKLSLDDVILEVNRNFDEKFASSSDKPKRVAEKPIVSVVHTCTRRLVFKANTQYLTLPENIQNIFMNSTLEYSMDRKSRGKCVIFNHEYFNSAHLSTRKGTNKDADDLEACFRGLGFKVKVYKDYRVKEIEALLRALSKEDHSDADCLVFCVLTHGSQRKLSAKDAEYEIDSLFEYFTPENCPTLNGKPKIFFIQACRGKKLDDGHVMTIDTKKNKFAASLIHQGDESDSNRFKFPRNGEGPLNFKIPIRPDFFIAYSTIYGFKSFRNPCFGSWFIQVLTKTMKNFASEFCLHEIITKVNHEIAYNFLSNTINEADNEKKQAATTVYTLKRRLFINPVAVENDQHSIAGTDDIENSPENTIHD